MTKNQMVGIYALGAFLLFIFKVPQTDNLIIYIKEMFNLLSTIFHESGHAVVGGILGLDVLAIQVNLDTSGFTAYTPMSYHSLPSSQKAMVAIAGIVFQTMIAIILVLSLKHSFAKKISSVLLPLILFLPALAWMNYGSIGWYVAFIAGAAACTLLVPFLKVVHPLVLNFFIFSALWGLTDTIAYIFDDGGEHVYSDTGKFAEIIGMPHDLVAWGIFLICYTLIFISIWSVIGASSERQQRPKGLLAVAR